MIGDRKSRWCFAAAALTAAMVPCATAFENEGAELPASCVHETAYESFAGLILVSVTVGESPPLDFVLDSGASQSSVTDPVLAWALGLEVTDTGLARGVGAGATRVAVADEIRVRIDGIEVLRTPLVVHDIGELLKDATGRELHGFLGADLFEKFVVEINPVGQRLRLHDPETFRYQGPGAIVPLEVVDQRPVVQGRVRVKKGGKEVPVRLVADTGSGRSLALIIKSRRHLKPPVKQSKGASIGVVGVTEVVIASTDLLRLGSIEAADVETAWLEAFGVPAVRNIEHLHGILGNQFMGQLRTIFDYKRGRLILEPIGLSER
jgi:hypothetical protein